MNMKLFASAVTVSSLLFATINPTLANTVFSVNKILNINPVNRGSTIIYGVRATADTSQCLPNSTRKVAGAR